MFVAEIKNPFQGVPARIELEEEELSRGGEGTVYRSIDGEWAVKIYHKDSEAKLRKITQVMEIFRNVPAEHERFLVPPKGLVVSLNGRPALGIVMRFVKVKELYRVIAGMTALEEQLEAGRTWRDYLRIARAVAETMVVLHGKGCAHSDVHYHNFLADLQTNTVVMLETDGVVVDGFLPPDVKGLRGFMAPEVVTDGVAPNERTDRWSLAVLVLHTLLFRNVMKPLRKYDLEDSRRDDNLAFGEFAVFSEHPTNKINLLSNTGKPVFEGGQLSYKMLTPRLRRLTEEALIDGLRSPDVRPSSRQWMNALAIAEDELFDCQNCGQPFPFPYREPVAGGGYTTDTPVFGEGGEGEPACPFCGIPLLDACGGMRPVVLHLYDEKTPAEYRLAGRVLVLADGAPLYPDATSIAAAIPAIGRTPENKIGHLEWDAQRGRFALYNETENSEWNAWTFGGARQTARPGQALLLEIGLCIRFGLAGDVRPRGASGELAGMQRMALVAEAKKVTVRAAA